MQLSLWALTLSIRLGCALSQELSTALTRVSKSRFAWAELRGVVPAFGVLVMDDWAMLCGGECTYVHTFCWYAV